MFKRARAQYHCNKQRDLSFTLKRRFNQTTHYLKLAIRHIPALPLPGK